MNETAARRDYRANVGLALFHRSGKVFLGCRVGLDPQAAHAWQMPQGGVDSDETPRAAALRELSEEIGVDSELVEILEETSDWLAYDFPPEVHRRLGKRARWRGQKQKWFALGFRGEDSDIRLDRHVQEFSTWRWAALEAAPALVVPFKREVYEEVARRFARYAKGDWH